MQHVVCAKVYTAFLSGFIDAEEHPTWRWDEQGHRGHLTQFVPAAERVVEEAKRSDRPALHAVGKETLLSFWPTIITSGRASDGECRMALQKIGDPHHLNHRDMKASTVSPDRW